MHNMYNISHNYMLRPILGHLHVVVRYIVHIVHKLCCILTDNYINILIQLLNVKPRTLGKEKITWTLH